MADLAKRITKWQVKTDPAKVQAVLAGLRDMMTNSVNAVFPELVQLETETKQVLDGEGIATIQYPFYLDFARELFRLRKRGISGSSLQREVQVLMAKWTDRGLAAPVLEKIRTQVFDVAVFSPGP